MILNALNEHLFGCKKNIPLQKNGVIANAISIGKIASHLVTIVLLMFQISIKACSKSSDLLVIKIFCYSKYNNGRYKTNHPLLLYCKG